MVEAAMFLTMMDARVLQSKRASEVQKDINAWEENRLFTSGVVRAREVRPQSA
jgi:hypothetical protein